MFTVFPVYHFLHSILNDLLLRSNHTWPLRLRLSLIFAIRFLKMQTSSVNTIQWRIQDFPDGGESTTLSFGQIFPENCMKYAPPPWIRQCNHLLACKLFLTFVANAEVTCEQSFIVHISIVDWVVWPAEGAPADVHGSVQREYQGRRHGPRLLHRRHDPPGQDLQDHPDAARERPARWRRRLRQTVPHQTRLLHRWLQNLPDHPHQVSTFKVVKELSNHHHAGNPYITLSAYACHIHPWLDSSSLWDS